MSSDTLSVRDAENKGPTALAIVVCVSVLSTVFTAARLFTRGKVLGKISLDDYFIVASVVSSTSFLCILLPIHDKHDSANIIDPLC